MIKEFFSKKRLLEKEEVEQDFIIQKRIKSLYDNLGILQKHGYPIELFETYSCKISTKYRAIIINTAYGAREALLTDKSIAYGKPNFYYISTLENNKDSRVVKKDAFFHIECLAPFLKLPSSVNVELDKRYPMTPKEIDLAILEVENHVQELLRDNDIKQRAYQEYIDYFSKKG